MRFSLLITSLKLGLFFSAFRSVPRKRSTGQSPFTPSLPEPHAEVQDSPTKQPSTDTHF